MIATAKSSYICNFDLKTPEITLRNHDTLVEVDGCLHIRKMQHKNYGVEFYVMADWSCSVPQPQLNNNICDKNNVSNVRVSVKKHFKSPARREQSITYKLVSRKSSLLEFRDGQRQGKESVVTNRDDPILLLNIFKKTGVPNVESYGLPVICKPQEQLMHAPINAEVYLWEGEPDHSVPHILKTDMSFVVLPKGRSVVSYKDVVRKVTNRKISNRSKKTNRRDFKMDPSIIATILTWLSPYLVKGTLELSKSVGRGLGENFVEVIEDIFKGTPEIFSASNEQNEQTNSRLEAINSILEKHPEKFVPAYRELRASLKKLLRNKDFFTKVEIQETLVPNLYYASGEFDESIQDRLVNGFVDKVFADGKVEKLIKEIQSMKPRLFE